MPLSSNLIMPTIAYTMKQKGKTIVNKRKNLSFSNDKEKYVCGLNNLSYSPMP